MQVGRQLLHVDAAPQAARGRLFVRPEAIRLAAAPEPAGAGAPPNTFLAEVQDGVFLGSHYRVALRIDGMPGHVLQAVVAPQAGDALLDQHAAGRCWVELPRHALRPYA